MRNGHDVIDADGHVVEPADLWERYTEPAFADVAPRVTSEGFVEVGGYRQSRFLEDPRYGDQLAYTNDLARARGYDAASQLEAMDVDGIDRMVLFPSRGLYALAVPDLDGGLASAIADAYNRWLADFCSANRERLLGVGLVSLHDPSRAADDAVRAVREHGMRALMIRPNPVGGRNLEDRTYDDFYAAAADLGVAVAVHEGSGVHLPEYGTDRFDSHLAWHAMSHTMEQMGAVYSFTVGGVTTRHPSLRVLVLEAGASWLPHWLHRLDEHVEWIGDVWAPDLAALPSELFARSMWISFESDESRFVAPLLDALGEDRLLWASDYPHPDAAYPGMVDRLHDEWTGPAGALRRILDANPRAAYGI